VSDDKVSIEVDGQQLSARKGAMLIEVTDAAGISIPRFCYHDKLSIAANCRMCLVEVEKAPKPMPACATPVMDGMKVFTNSQRAVQAQRGTMEFLLINHPLDCPICDQGGECELQDVAMGYGHGVSRYADTKRVVFDKDIGPLIATEMTRCIHCTRCVRFGEEIAGLRELGATGRGEDLRIGTYVEKSVVSELSGNVIDMCPVGALTAKPSRYTARAWELLQHAGIATHDCVGSNLFHHTRDGRVMRVVPKENPAINEVWLSDRDRFSYEGLYSDARLRQPLLKEDGEWHAVEWETALAAAGSALTAVAPPEMGFLATPGASLEELYLLQKLARGIGCANIDHRLRQLDFDDQMHDPVMPWLGQNLGDLEQLQAALVVAGNVRKDQPLVAHRLRKAALNGARVSLLNVREYEQTFPTLVNDALAPAALLQELRARERRSRPRHGKCWRKSNPPPGNTSWLTVLPARNVPLCYWAAVRNCTRPTAACDSGPAWSPKHPARCSAICRRAATQPVHGSPDACRIVVPVARVWIWSARRSTVCCAPRGDCIFCKASNRNSILAIRNSRTRRCRRRSALSL
jgi:NADH-quinone oxidoreductase subunit G